MSRRIRPVQAATPNKAATRLILTGLADAEIAEVMAWWIEKVSGIRRTYVDQSRAIVAIGERIMKAGANRRVNRSTRLLRFPLFHNALRV